MDPKFRRDDEVRLKSQPDRAGKITGDPVLLQGEFWYPIYFGPGQSGRHPESDLELYQGTTDPLQILRDGRFAGREAFSKLVTHLKLATALRSHIYALQASRTTFYAYQFKPVLKFLESWKHRLLIADEVGLGKTIEAGLIMTEYRARFDLDRVLIVPPAHLITKWQQEMKQRFDLDFEILDRKRALEFLRRFEEEGEATRLKGILSLQTLRGRALQERWEAVAPTFNIVVFDEAGRLRNPGTLSNKAARVVAEGADGQLLLTATPIQTSDADLFNLLALLDPSEFGSLDVYRLRLQTNAYILEALRTLRGGTKADLERCAALLIQSQDTLYGSKLAENPMFSDLLHRLASARNPSRRQVIELQSDLNSLNLFGHYLSRTRKREVEEKRPIREAHVVRCNPTRDETEFYSLVTQICQAAYVRARNNTIAALATMMPQRQVASCMLAMLEYTREKLKTQQADDEFQEISDLRVDDYDVDEADQVPTRVDWRRLGDLDAWQARLEENDSKWKSLTQAMDILHKLEPGCKVIVFSYFKKTLAYPKKRLAKIGVRSVLISGDVPTSADDPDRDERGRRVESFRTDPGIQVSLSTEVGNEGLDMEFAHALINYDLSWNPMVVEQRIGRLDRIGQHADKILIFNLTMPGTIDDLILERLYRRIRVFETSIGDLEEILGEVVRQLTQTLFSSALTPEQQEQRIRQAADVIEARRLQLEQLESRVSDLIGHDEYFKDEISRVRDSRRYVTGEELIIFVQDFLAAQFPDLGMEPAGKSGCVFR